MLMVEVGTSWREKADAIFRRARLCCLFCCAAFLSSHACAESFAALFERALGNEPAYLAAATSRDAARARTGQALGAMLPQVSLSANKQQNAREYDTRGPDTPPQQDRYDSSSSQLSINQPVWRQANLAGLRQAEAAAAQAEHQFAGAEMDLLSRLATAWFDLLAARDGVLHAAQQVAATRRQWETMQRGAELGTASLPQAEEARAKYDQALAESVAQETDSRIKRAALEQLAGPLGDTHLPVLRDDAVPSNMGMEPIETWLERVESDNPAVRAAREAFVAAGHEVDKQRAGHLPTLDLVATYGKNSQATGSFPGQAGYDIKQASLGLQLNIPIYSGGTQSAKVEEAVAMREKARLEMDGAWRGARFAAQQAWFGWQGAAARAEASAQVVRAAQASLQVARRGLEHGLKTDLDVLQAELQLATARRDLRKARYDQVVAQLKLKAATGTVARADVAAVDRMFAADAPVAPAMPPKRSVPPESFEPPRPRIPQGVGI